MWVDESMAVEVRWKFKALRLGCAWAKRVRCLGCQMINGQSTTGGNCYRAGNSGGPAKLPRPPSLAPLFFEGQFDVVVTEIKKGCISAGQCYYMKIGEEPAA